MPRIVFFGVSGAFSTTPLRHLARSELCPSLVVMGREIQPGLAFRGLKRWPCPKTRWAKAWAQSPARQRTRPFEDLVNAAHELGIDAVETTDANQLRLLRILASLKPELFVVAGFPHLFSPALLQLASRGAVNIHPGRLPEERGPAPLFWRLKSGATEVDLTLHLLDAGEDSGPIVARDRFAFEPGEDAQAILKRAAQLACPHLIKAVRGLLQGELVLQIQNASQASRKPRPKFSDGQIDPSLPARAVFAMVSALAPYYSLFVDIARDRYFIEGAVDYDETATLPVEYALLGDTLILRCHPGVVRLRLKPGGALFASDY